MVAIQITLKDQTLVSAIQAASQHGISLDQYIDMRLSDKGEGGEIVPSAAMIDPENAIDRDAEAVFDLALKQPPQRRPYQVQDLHNDLNIGAWKEMGANYPSRIGKAFMRLVKAQPDTGFQLEGDIYVRVEPTIPTAQNQMQYRTVRVE